MPNVDAPCRDHHPCPPTPVLCGVPREEYATAVAVTNVSHIRLTVTDSGRSRAFYDAVFGFDVALEVPGNAGIPAEALSFLFGGVIYAFPGGLLGLRPAAPELVRLDEDRAGLERLSCAVPSVDDLTRAASLPEEFGVDHGGSKHLTAVSLAILEFRDPDGIALEPTAPSP